MVKQVRKAVLPVAGLGTRFLPATKSMPKEMLTVVDKPLIQYAVEEAMGAGIEEVILVTGRGKAAMEDHFDYAVELEHALAERGKKAEIERVRSCGHCHVAEQRTRRTRGRHFLRRLRPPPARFPWPPHESHGAFGLR